MCPDSSSFYIIFEHFRGPDEDNLPTTSEESPMSDIPADKQPLSRTVWKASTVAIQTSHDASIKRTKSVKDASSPWDQTRDADDSVSMSTTPTKPAMGEVKSEILKTIVFRNPIPLYKVAVLAETIHRCQNKYRVKDRSCFFYALAIFSVMYEYYKDNVDKLIDGKFSIKAGKVPALSNTPMRNTFSIEAVDNATIISSYQGELEKFKVKVCSFFFTF